MEDNYYKERNIMTKLPVILLISLGVLLLIALAFFLFRFFNKKESFNIEENFLQVGKSYYSSNYGELPKEKYECTSVTLEILLSKNLIDNVEHYNSCNKYNTKLKVCKLESDKYQYTPILVCDSINTEEKFSDWKVGTEKDLIADSSDVSFSFLGYKKVTKEPSEIMEQWEDEIAVKDYTVISTTTYYRFRDKEWQWQETSTEYFDRNDVGSNLAYYATSPDESYPNSDSGTTAYKWYIEEPIVTSPIKKYACKNPIGSAVSYKDKPCSESIDGKTETVKEFYTCGVTEKNQSGSTSYVEVAKDDLCDCSSYKYGSNCSIKRTYYPSDETNSNRETVYYTAAPVRGAIKDVSTKLTVYRYYKEVTTTTSKYYSKSPSETAIKVGNGRWGSWTSYSITKPKDYETRQIETRKKIKYQLEDSNAVEWDKISSDYLPLEEFINKLKDLEYNVSTIKDVNNNQDLKYEVQLKYRKQNN